MAVGGFGLLGNLFSGLFGGNGASNVLQNTTSDIVGGNMFNLDSTPTDLGSTINNTGQSTFASNPQVAESVFNAGIGEGFKPLAQDSQLGSPTSFRNNNPLAHTGSGITGGQAGSGGLGLSLDGLTKIAGLGASIWNDYKNRKYREDVANLKVDDKNNRRAQTRAIKNQLKTGKTTDELSGKDLEHIG